MKKIKTIENFEMDKPYQKFCIFNKKTNKFWGKPKNSIKDNQWIKNVTGKNYEGWINWYNYKEAKSIINSGELGELGENLEIMYYDDVL